MRIPLREDVPFSTGFPFSTSNHDNVGIAAFFKMNEENSRAEQRSERFISKLQTNIFEAVSIDQNETNSMDCRNLIVSLAFPLWDGLVARDKTEAAKGIGK